jgi:hypothetical protein
MTEITEDLKQNRGSAIWSQTGYFTSQLASLGSRDSSVTTVTRLQARTPRNRGSIYDFAVSGLCPADGAAGISSAKVKN